jgi:drug/metabolite transporter (DMT)-like permease
MIFLVATILLNALLYIIFKFFAKYKIDALQAIVVNYWTCVVVGSCLLGRFPIGASSLHYQWSLWAFVMGGVFISLFNLIAYCTRVDGITTTTIANKLSLVIPVIFSVFLYNETLNAAKLAGIAIAFPAVYFTTRVPQDGKKGQSLFWPALLFLGSGLLDTMIKYVESKYIDSSESLGLYTIHVFFTAGSIGAILVGIRMARGKAPLAWRNIVAGVVLSIPNYFSIYYLIQLLNSGFLQSSAAIPINNIGIVLASALAAIIFFREKATTMRIIGLILSVVAIILIAYTDF